MDDVEQHFDRPRIHDRQERHPLSALILNDLDGTLLGPDAMLSEGERMRRFLAERVGDRRFRTMYRSNKNRASDETREKIDDGLEAVGDAITFWD
ncbi:hypothetical protein [Nocardioides luteus]|uniref:hypothetical protein n=1 Tax=Nocardioides luteus TaxID=1844 RepID=UPI0018C9CE5A|nr:hypothetical protein [Nocardioides luteus]MBG6096923.1 hypothetical protein [Nocardioides luteus]